MLFPDSHESMGKWTSTIAMLVEHRADTSGRGWGGGFPSLAQALVERLKQNGGRQCSFSGTLKFILYFEPFPYFFLCSFIKVLE